jgi:UDPglucose 6-dehydrogenase
MKIGFIGMSHLGLVNCIGAAAKGCSVIGFDQDSRLIASLKSEAFPINEPYLIETYNEYRESVSFTTEFEELTGCDIIYFSLDIKTDVYGSSNLVEIEALLKYSVRFIRKDSYFVMLSQVPPGFTRQIKELYNLNISYQVETLIFGNAFERFFNPERFIIGLDTPDTNLNPTHKRFLEMFDCDILTMSFESAELAKISINIFLASTITTTNILSELAGYLQADWWAIKNALSLDRRIGKYSYLEPGLGISGGNIERDLVSARKLLDKFEAGESFIESIQINSQFRKLWPSRLIKEKLDLPTKNWKIAIWGLAYKKNTNSTKNSPAIANMQVLSLNCSFNVFDPELVIPEYDGLPLTIFSNILDSINNVDALIIFNDSSYFSEISVDEIVKRMKGNLVIDPLNVLRINQFKDLDYHSFGNKWKGGK